jgi:hypothetical protein
VVLVLAEGQLEEWEAEDPGTLLPVEKDLGEREAEALCASSPVVEDLEEWEEGKMREALRSLPVGDLEEGLEESLLLLPVEEDLGVEQEVNLVLQRTRRYKWKRRERLA